MPATATSKPPMKGRDPKKQLADAQKEQRKLKAKSNKDKHELGFLATFQAIAKERGLTITDPVRDFEFHPTRKWKFDWAWPWLRNKSGRIQIAVEIHGGTNSRTAGRHNRRKGIKNDRDKVNEANSLGWRVLEFTDSHTYEHMANEVLKVMTGKK